MSTTETKTETKTLTPALGGWKRALTQVGALTLAAGAGALAGYTLARRQQKPATPAQPQA